MPGGLRAKFFEPRPYARRSPGEIFLFASDPVSNFFFSGGTRFEFFQARRARNRIFPLAPGSKSENFPSGGPLKYIFPSRGPRILHGPTNPPWVPYHGRGTAMEGSPIGEGRPWGTASTESTLHGGFVMGPLPGIQKSKRLYPQTGNRPSAGRGSMKHAVRSWLAPSIMGPGVWLPPSRTHGSQTKK
jgi:hypothetical protein